MNRFVAISSFVAGVGLTGCAYIEFGAEDGLVYYEPVPYLLVATRAECAMTASLLTLPGRQRRLRFVNGYGVSNLSATLTADGMITVIGHNADAKPSETIAALAALKAATSPAAVVPDQSKESACGTVISKLPFSHFKRFTLAPAALSTPDYPSRVAVISVNRSSSTGRVQWIARLSLR